MPKDTRFTPSEQRRRNPSDESDDVTMEEAREEVERSVRSHGAMQ